MYFNPRKSWYIKYCTWEFERSWPERMIWCRSASIGFGHPTTKEKRKKKQHQKGSGTGWGIESKGREEGERGGTDLHKHVHLVEARVYNVEVDQPRNLPKRKAQTETKKSVSSAPLDSQEEREGKGKRYILVARKVPQKSNLPQRPPSKHNLIQHPSNHLHRHYLP